MTITNPDLNELEIKLLKASTVYHANRKSAAAARTAGDLAAAADLDDLTAEAWKRVQELNAEVQALRSGKPTTEGGAA